MRIRIRSVFAIVAGMALLAACGGAEDPAGGAAGEGAAAGTEATGEVAGGQEGLTPLTVGTSASITLHTLPAIAVDQGFDEANGLDLEIQMFPSGSAMVEAVATGELQVAQAGDVPYLSLVAGGVPVRLLGELTDSGANYGFYMAADQAPENPEDVHGARIGLPFGSTSSIIMDGFIDAYGLDESQIELIDLAPDAIAAAHSSGEIDGFVLWSPGSNRAAAERETVKIHDAYTSYLPCCEGEQKLGAAHTVVFAREEALSEDPEVVEQYLQTLIDAKAFLEDPATAEEGRRIIAEALEVDDELVAQALEEIEYPLALDQGLIDDMSVAAEQLVASGSVTEVPPLEEVLAPEPLSAVAPDNVEL